MKKITVLCALIGAMSLTPFEGFADQPVALHLNNKKGRPKLPGNKTIMCYQDGSALRFELPDGTMCATVEIGDYESTTWATTVTVDDPTCEVSNIQGEYIITVTTDQFQSFSGTITF